jgi:hypothetical protein
MNDPTTSFTEMGLHRQVNPYSILPKHAVCPVLSESGANAHFAGYTGRLSGSKTDYDFCGSRNSQGLLMYVRKTHFPITVGG